MKNLSIIAAVARNNAIGKGGDLLCHLSADLQRFKALTTQHTIIMGRRTFESLPKGALPNRRNIVVTRNPAFSAPGVETFLSLEDALWAAKDDGEVFVIGGEQIYRETIAMASRLYLTHIDASFSGADELEFLPIKTVCEFYGSIINYHSHIKIFVNAWLIVYFIY